MYSLFSLRPSRLCGLSVLLAGILLATGGQAARKTTEVVLPFGTPAPAELVPVKPGTTTKVSPALTAELKVGPLAPVTAVCFTPDGKGLLAGSYGRVTLWDLQAGKVLRHLDGIEGAVQAIAASPDGKRIGVAGGKPGQSGTVLLYDAAAPEKPVVKLAGDTDVVYSFAWSPDSKRIATASPDKLVRIWDAAAGTTTVTIKDHSDSVFAVAFSPDGKLLASGGKDKSVKLFQADTGKSIRTLSGHNADVLAVAVAPDGKSVLSSGAEPGVRWWNRETGAVTRTVGGHGGEVHDLRFSADGKTLLSVSEDGTARLWDGTTGALQKSFSSGGEPLWSAALSPDGQRVAAGGGAGLLRLWDVTSGRLLVLGFESPERAAQPEALLATPEGYVSATPGLGAALQWRVGGEAVPSEPFSKALARPEEVLKALRGEAVTPPKF